MVLALSREMTSDALVRLADKVIEVALRMWDMAVLFT